MGLWRFLQAELLVHPLLSLQEGILVNCWEGIPQQLQLGAAWGRNPPAAPQGCIAAAPAQGTQKNWEEKGGWYKMDRQNPAKHGKGKLFSGQTFPTQS